jgi:hypothetical protein
MTLAVPNSQQTVHTTNRPAISGKRCCDSVWTILLNISPLFYLASVRQPHIFPTLDRWHANMNWSPHLDLQRHTIAADGVTHSLPLTTHHQYGSTTSISPHRSSTTSVVEPGWSIHKDDVQHLHVRPHYQHNAFHRVVMS